MELGFLGSQDLDFNNKPSTFESVENSTPYPLKLASRV
jgi:hypothetical protein